MELSKSNFDVLDKVRFAIKVIDILGNEIDSKHLSQIFIKSITRVDSDDKSGSKSLYSGTVEKAGESNELFEVDLTSSMDSSKNLVPGVYSLEMEISPQSTASSSGSSSIKANAYFQVTTMLSVNDVHIGVGDKKELDVSSLQRVTVQRGVKHVVGSGTKKEFLHVAFSANPKDDSSGSSTPFSPQQSVLKLTHTTSNEVVVFQFKRQARGGRYSHVAISLAETSGVHSTLHLTGGGRFSAAILLGDVRGRDAVCTRTYTLTCMYTLHLYIHEQLIF